MFPTNNPNPENAMKLTDLYFTIQKEEKLNDFITTKTSKSLGQKNFSILLMVTKKSGTRMDTVQFYEYSKLQS
jgi:hypothetical protein